MARLGESAEPVWHNKRVGAVTKTYRAKTRTAKTIRVRNACLAYARGERRGGQGGGRQTRGSPPAHSARGVNRRERGRSGQRHILHRGYTVTVEKTANGCGGRGTGSSPTRTVRAVITGRPPTHRTSFSRGLGV